MSCCLGGCLCEVLTTILPCYGCLQICRGPVGPTGPTGQTGSGITASPFLTPFSSGTNGVTLTSGTSIIAGTGSLLAFGSNISEITIGSTSIGSTLTGANLPYEAYATPTNLLITDIYGEFIYTGSDTSLPDSGTLYLTVYTAASGSTVFTRTGASASVNIYPAPTSNVFVFISNFSPITVLSQSKIILVLSFSITPSPATSTTLTGLVSAGIRGFLS